jgi:tetratricopeptide (TPR) repeat protein
VTEYSLERVLALREAGQISPAMACGVRLALIEPDVADVLHLVGVLHCENGELERGCTLLQQATRVDSRQTSAWLNIARARRRLGHQQAALEAIDKVTVLAPDDFSASQLAANCVGTGSLPTGDRRHSPSIHHRATVIDPSSSEAATSAAANLKRRGFLEAALRMCQRAVALAPAIGSVLICHAELLAETANAAGACRFFSWAWHVEPDSHDAPYYLSLVQLRSGAFEDGWTNYEHRWYSSVGVAHLRDSAAVMASRPRYVRDGRGKRVLVWAEQGLGDEIMFGGLLGEFSRNCDRLLVQLDPRLVGLFARSMPEIEFISFNEQLPVERYDEQLPMGSLGKLLRPTRRSFSGKGEPYLFARSGSSERFRADLLVDSRQFLVGISWRSANPDSGLARSIPLAELLDSLKTERVRFLDLQYGDAAVDIAHARDTVGVELLVHPRVDTTRDIDGLAGLIDCCDLVVSIGNATAHLSGAMGKRTWVLLPHVAGWRWLDEGDECPWYPNSRLFRQTRRGDWSGVFVALRDALRREFSQ